MLFQLVSLKTFFTFYMQLILILNVIRWHFMPAKAEGYINLRVYHPSYEDLFDFLHTFDKVLDLLFTSSLS